MEIQLLQDWVENYDEMRNLGYSKKLLIELQEQYSERIGLNLENGQSSEMKRVIFYSIGTAEAMLIESTNPNWKQDYFNNLFNTDVLFEL